MKRENYNFIKLQDKQSSLQKINGNLAPCLAYFTSFSPVQPSTYCCGGLNTLVQKADTTQNLRDQCDSFKKAFVQFNVNADKKKQLLQLLTSPFHSLLISN